MLDSSTSFDAPRLRAILAERRIPRTRFADACGLDRSYVHQLLAGYRKPGELAVIKMSLGCRKLGIRLDTDGGPHAA